MPRPARLCHTSSTKVCEVDHQALTRSLVEWNLFLSSVVPLLLCYLDAIEQVLKRPMVDLLSLKDLLAQAVKSLPIHKPSNQCALNPGRPQSLLQEMSFGCTHNRLSPLVTAPVPWFGPDKQIITLENMTKRLRLLQLLIPYEKGFGEHTLPGCYILPREEVLCLGFPEDRLQALIQQPQESRHVLWTRGAKHLLLGEHH
jgi:hypothetical protein